MEMLLKTGAKDVWLTQVLMKKGRPGVVLSVICPLSLEGAIAACIFKETTTLGIRRLACDRHILHRTMRGEKKSAYLGKRRLRTKSEFELARQKAEKTGLPLLELLK
jgi:uncharacterized protein (DUF111 family)